MILIPGSGPEPNYFSHSPDSVRIDDNGRLRLTIRRQGGRWLCSEVVNIHQFGYGWHIFRLASPGFTSAASVDHHPAAPDNKTTADLRDRLISSWEYALSSLVPRKSTKIRINFWLFERTPPTDGREQELIVDSYEFFPDR